MLWKSLIILTLGALLVIAGWESTAHVQPEVGGQSAVFLDLSAVNQASQKVNLAGARNEYLDFPVMVRGASPYLQAALEGRERGIESKIFRVAAVPPGSAGTYPPDALIPLGEEYPRPDSGSLPLWVSVKISPGCSPGVYDLNLVISDRGKDLRLPVELKIFRFALPQDLPITIFAGFWHQPQIWSQLGINDPDSQIRIIKRYYRSLREYKVNALGGSYPLPLNRIQPGQKIEEFTAYHELLRYALDELDFTYCQIPRLKNWKSVTRAQSPFIQQAQNFYPCYQNYLRRHGWENRTLNYLVDEPREAQSEAVVQAYTQAKALIPPVRGLSAGWHPPPEYARIIDIWAYQAAHFRDDDQERSRRQGQEAWLYANRLHGVGQPLTHPRLIGWLLYRYQFSGYLLWGVNFWPHNPWTSLPGPKDYYRRGSFYYPHPQTGLPIPTTRLEALRRGFQDYQYLLILEQAVSRGLVSPEEEAAVQAQVHRFTENLPRSSFPVSMAELEAVRLKIGHLLDEAQGLPREKKSLARGWSRGAAFKMFISRR